MNNMVERIQKTTQIRPIDGAKIASLMRGKLDIDASDSLQKNALIDQLLINLCSNAAAIRYIRDTDSNGWTKLHDSLVKRFGEEQAEEIFIGTLPTATKGKVHTPHPTESLTREAIRSHNEIMRILLSPEADGLFSEKPGNEVPEVLLTKAQELWDGLKPPAANLTIDHEMTRSIRASERSWDAIEAQMVSASSILNLAEKHEGKPIPIEILEAFYYTNEAFTWTPGDQDSKPDMIESLFPAGVEKNSVAMWQRYMKALADLASKMPDDSPEKT